MARVAVLFLAAFLATGCGGSEKELPKDILPPDDRGKEPPVVVPKQSDPEAVKFVQERIAAATGGKPERLEKLKVFRQKAGGRWKWPDSQIPVNATRDVAGVWPGKLSVSVEFSAGQIKETHLSLRSGSARLSNNAGSGFMAFDPPNPKETDAIVAAETLAEQWLPLLVPLTDPQVVLFDVKEQPIDNQMARTVKVVLPDRPIYTLWFDPSGALGMISFLHAEFGGKPIQKRVSVAGYKPVDGVALPTLFVYRRDGTSVQEWTVSRWEFPDRIDDAAFEPKK